MWKVKWTVQLWAGTNLNSKYSHVSVFHPPSLFLLFLIQVKETTGLLTQIVRRCSTTGTSGVRERGDQIWTELTAQLFHLNLKTAHTSSPTPPASWVPPRPACTALRPPLSPSRPRLPPRSTAPVSAASHPAWTRSWRAAGEATAPGA